MADVSVLDAAAASNVDDWSYVVGAGVDRGLVVGVQAEGAITPGAVTVTYGGQAMTEFATVHLEAGATDNECTLFLLLEAGIAAAVGTTIAITGQVANFTSHAKSFENVNQTGGATTVPETNNAQTPDPTPNPLTTSDIAAGAGSAVVALAGVGNATTATWGGTNPLTEDTDINDASPTTAGSLASALFASALNADVEATWLSQNRACVVAMELAPTAATPTITDFGDEEHDDKEAGVIVTGTVFEAVQGTGVVEVSDNAVFGAGTIVQQVVTAWADLSITITMALGAIAPGTPRYLWVTNDSGQNNVVGFQFHFHRERMFKLQLSDEIPSGGGGSNTTQQMTPPAGKGAPDFGGGKITDDINPATNLTDVPADDYREDEQNYQAIDGAAVPGTTHEFRDTIAGVPMDVESVNPRWTILEGGSVPVTHPARVVSRQSGNRASNF